MLDSDVFLCFYIQVSVFATFLCDVIHPQSTDVPVGDLCDTMFGGQADILNITFKSLFKKVCGRRET